MCDYCNPRELNSEALLFIMDGWHGMGRKFSFKTNLDVEMELLDISNSSQNQFAEQQKDLIPVGWL